MTPATGLFAFSPEEAATILKTVELPCFVYRRSVARERYAALRRALPKEVVLAYAVKANPHPELLAVFGERGAWFDTASSGELERVRDAGAEGSRILFAGPGKSDAEIRLALDLGARIQVDGIEDLERLDALVGSRLPVKPVRVSVRVHPASGVTETGAGGNAIIGGTGPSPFGVDEENIGSFLKEAKRFKTVRISGLQVFAASNEKDAERLLLNHEAAIAIAERMVGEFGLQLELVDLGGGLGIPYSEDEPTLDIDAFGRGLKELLNGAPWFTGKLLVEPGRWLSGPSGVYLTRVIRTKESRGTRFAVLEGGVNHLLRPLLTGQAFPVACVRQGTEGSGTGDQLLVHTLAGPLCTSLDRLGTACLPELKAGDILMMGQCGAYGYTEAMSLFLSHPAAGEYWKE